MQETIMKAIMIIGPIVGVILLILITWRKAPQDISNIECV